MKKTIVVLLALFCLVSISNAQSKMGVSVQGAVSFLMNSNSNEWNPSFGGLGTFSYNLSKNLDLIGTVGYLTQTYKSNSDFTHSQTLILGGIRYYFTENDFKPYVTAQTGLFYSKSNFTASGIGFTLTSSSSSTLGFSGGAGFLYKLSDKFNLDCTATINSATDTFINLAAGVNMVL